MSATDRPSVRQASRPGEDPQQAVARARAGVLGGRGPGARRSETDRYQHGRFTLGPLPAPLERELVHLQTVGIRMRDPEAGVPDVDSQRHRLRQAWAGEPGPGTSRRGEPWHRLLSLALAVVLGHRRR